MVLRGNSDAVVVFALGEFRFALSMTTVQRVLRAVEISPLRGSHPDILGVINLHGHLVEVYDIRPRFGLEPREVRVTDHLVIARVNGRDVAVLVDAAVDVLSANEAPVTLATDMLANLDDVEGVVLQGDAVVPIHNLGRFLPAETFSAKELKLVA